jgi:hypothetical protein
MNEVDVEEIKENYLTKSLELMKLLKRLKTQIIFAEEDIDETYSSEWMKEHEERLDFSSYCDNFRNTICKMEKKIDELEQTLKLKKESKSII